MIPPEMLAERLKLCLSILEEIGDDMNTASSACTCCGLTRRENMDDYQAKQSIEGAANRISKLYEKLFDGEWSGRELVPVVDAETLRGDGR